MAIEKISSRDGLLLVGLGLAFSLIPSTTFIPRFGLLLGILYALAAGFVMVFVLVFVFGRVIEKKT
ncbi:MAG: hypothetical protein QXS81_01250 [Candidatus Micrarchaeaceae archaeon]